MWMKLIFFLILIFPNISFCDRRRRDSILKGETGKISTAFDLSNLDRQEALDGIDKEKLENLIRKQRFWQRNSGDWNEYLKQYNVGNYLTVRNGIPDGVRLKNRENLSGEDGFENGKYYSPTECFIREKKDAEPESTSEKLNGTTTEPYGDDDDDDDAEDNDFEDYDDEEDTRRKRRRKKKRKRHHHWGKWTRWSPCSVTCGKGRKIRHRKCIAKVCRTGEIEMGEKACQLPACSLLDKILSIF